MPRLHPVSPADASSDVTAIFDTLQARLGAVPNLYRTAGHSDAALKGLLSLTENLGRGALDARTRERIALAVGEANGCDYCLAAHSAIASKLGLSRDEIRDARSGDASESKTQAILRFARRVVEARGEVSDIDVAQLRDAGGSDAEIVEVVANVALNLFTNYLNHVAATTIDFPRAEPLAAGVA